MTAEKEKEEGGRRKAEGAETRQPTSGCTVSARKEGATMTVRRQTPTLVARTRAYSLAAIRFYSELPQHTVARILGRQFLRSATSVGAQYREAQRAKSIADFLSKTEGALQELDETAYWLELIRDSGVDTTAASAKLEDETGQLLAIFTSITKKAKGRKLNG